MKTVLIAGHDPTLNQRWRAELEATGCWTALGPVQRVFDASVLLHRHDPELVITELRLVDGTVLDMIRVLKVGLGYLKSQVLVVGRTEGDDLLLDALQAGADNFFDASHPQGRTLAAQAADTLTGSADIAPWIARRLLDHFDLQPQLANPYNAIDQISSPLTLTPDERLVLRQLAIGRKPADIARLEGVTPRELAARVRTIYRKMQWDLRAGGLSISAA